jgi:exodeoxyribonuclease V alpha subunit
MPVELQGKVDKVAFYNKDNYYAVLRVTLKNFKQTTVTGIFTSVNEGDELKLTGEWKTHPKYGEQFAAESYEPVIHLTSEGIEKYLGSVFTEGIGEKLAKKITEKFGDKTLDVLDNNIEELLKIEGIGSKKFESIKKAWKEHSAKRKILVFLQGTGISANLSAKVYTRFGQESVRIIKENPYVLADEFFGVGFKMADSIAEKSGISKYSPVRIKAAAVYLLKKKSEDGHAYYPLEEFVRELAESSEIDYDTAHSAITDLYSDGDLFIEQSAEEANSKIKNVYLSEIYYCEKEAAKNLKLILSAPPKKSIEPGDSEIKNVIKEMLMDFSEEQFAAIKGAFKNKILAITGGPGTGKTTILRSILNIYRRNGLRFELAAPTGRAAKKLSELTGYEAKTIHRLLEYNPAQNAFSKDEDNPISADLIVIDEMSMVDIYLFNSLLKAVPHATRVIFSGDVDQLPSIGPGSVMKDILDSGVIPSVRLNEIYRQAKGSDIILNSQRIKEGKMIEIIDFGSRESDFLFIKRGDPERIPETIIDLCSRILPNKFGMNPFNDVQVITPMRKTSSGADNLNAQLQEALNDSRKEINRGAWKLKEGDKVIQTKNNYEKDVFNGDIGKVFLIRKESAEVIIDFDGRMVKYDFNDVDELNLAYAITVHKSQGSEYPCVIMPVTAQHFIMLQRNLLYTGITRGKKLTILIGEERAAAIAIRNNNSKIRRSSLSQRLKTGN